MNYSLLTEQQFQKKYYFLPENIKAVLDSENNMETARQICRAHHLNDEEKVLVVEQLIGLILLGFVPADDLSREISENIHLNKKHADDISSEINRKIFASIKSEIDKIYVPAGALVEEVPSIEILEEHTIDLRQIVKQREEKVKPLEIIKPKEEEKEIPREFAPVEGPVIIHKEAEIKPTLGIKKSLGGLFNLVGKKEEKPKPVEAQVEIGSSPQPIIDNKQPMRVVHYTEMRTPLGPTTQMPPKTPSAPPLSSIQPIVKKEEQKKEEPLVVSPLPELRTSKAEPKKEEEMIDLSTLKKV